MYMLLHTHHHHQYYDMNLDDSSYSSENGIQIFMLSQRE